jgi:hypothetical protein
MRLLVLYIQRRDRVYAGITLAIAGVMVLAASGVLT